MADRRQSFPFRFPWRKNRPTEEPEPRPTAKPQNPAQPTTTAPGERPPLRPAGKAPVKGSPSQAQAPPRTESPPASPSRAASESRKTRTPSRFSPSKKLQPTTQQTSSPSPTSESHPEVSEPKEAISQPPLRDPEPNTGIISETVSDALDSTPGETTFQADESSSKPTEVSALPDNSDSDTIGGDHKQISDPETESKDKKEVGALENEEKTDDQGHKASMQEGVTQFLVKDGEDHKQHSESESMESKDIKEAEKAVQVLAIEEKADDHGDKEPMQEGVTQLHAKDSEGHKQLSESELTESKEHQEEEKVIQVLTKQETSKDPGYREPMQERDIQLHPAAPDSELHAEDPRGVALQAEQLLEKQEIFDREDISTTSSDKKPIETASSTFPIDRSALKMFIQKMVSSPGEQVPQKKEIRDVVSEVDTLAAELQMLKGPVSDITLTGENRGATMVLIPEAKQEQSVPIRRSYKPNPDDSTEATTDGEETISEDQMSRDDPELMTYINSNVQSINNSIMFSSSLTEGNPGVSAVFALKSLESNEPNGKSDLLQTHKAQATRTPADKVTRESIVRRRCLRGLFMEPSDSEPDNPEKPQRHGCRVSCGEKGKETEIRIA